MVVETEDGQDFSYILLLSSLVYFDILGTIIDPSVICKGWMNMSGATKEAKFGFPSKMVLIRGKPNARVFCEAQKMAATISSRENPKALMENNLKRTASDPRCKAGRRVSRIKV
jgi:hypothetical protein